MSTIGLSFGDVLFIQDKGSKKVNKVYIDKNDNKLYKCIKDTESVSNTQDYFIEVTVNKNERDISKSKEYKELYFDYDDNYEKTEPGTMYHLSDNIYNYKYIYLVLEDASRDNMTQFIDTKSISRLVHNEVSFSNYKVDIGLAFYDEYNIKINYNNKMPGNSSDKKPHLVMVVGIN